MQPVNVFKEQFKKRIKNVYFILGFIGVVVNMLCTSNQDIHSWSQLLDYLLTILSDPARLFSTISIVVGIWVAPNTHGLGDHDGDGIVDLFDTKDDSVIDEENEAFEEDINE